MTKLTNFMKAIADDMYERYHRENIETEEDFDSMENIDFKHEVIDSAISSEYTGATEDMINEFGIGKAIFITLGAGIELQGMDPRQLSAVLLYQIAMEELDDYVTYEDYLRRGESNNESEEEEEGEEEGEEELNDDNVVVSGIVCKTCKFELPEMKMSEHLDKNNTKNKCKC